jgi:hypothetical protein
MSEFCTACRARLDSTAELIVHMNVAHPTDGEAPSERSAATRT